MDLIYTNSNQIDQGVLKNYSFDLSFGESENDFELTVGASQILEPKAFVYIDGTEHGGIVDGKKVSTDNETLTYFGRTWHGVINSKVIEPDAGKDYFVVSGDANKVLATLIGRLHLSGLFVVTSELSGITITNYQFERYCYAYDGIRTMLLKFGAKLKIEWINRSIYLQVVPIVDYTKQSLDNDTATLQIEQHQTKVNHLICLGKGELKAREVIHLYADQFGRIGNVQYYTGIDEVTETYDNSSSEDLRKDGNEKFIELRNSDKSEISINENETFSYDINDLVGSTEIITGMNVTATVVQKIVKINNGIINIEYKTGG